MPPAKSLTSTGSNFTMLLLDISILLKSIKVILFGTGR